jgi:hypothetical protein
MFLIPLVGGFLAGLLIESPRKALITTAVIWIVVASALIVLAASDEDLTAGTGAVILVGLIGFPLALGGRRIRGQRTLGA